MPAVNGAALSSGLVLWLKVGAVHNSPGWLSLLAIDSDLPQSSISAFQATGTAHIWAISGFDIRMHRICLAPHRSTQTLGY